MFLLNGFLTNNIHFVFWKSQQLAFRYSEEERSMIHTHVCMNGLLQLNEAPRKLKEGRQPLIS